MAAATDSPIHSAPAALSASIAADEPAPVVAGAPDAGESAGGEDWGTCADFLRLASGFELGRRGRRFPPGPGAGPARASGGGGAEQGAGPTAGARV
ncbi:MAG: hypothetical protein CML43_12945 [Rhodobacteraceae bacterium]|nr:hypothetical protein [Paracoccaceae bacterium]